MIEVTSRSGMRLFHSLKDGETAKLTIHGAVICHPERPPKLLKWDGAEELIEPSDVQESTMSEMIERVAKAIANEILPNCSDDRCMCCSAEERWQCILRTTPEDVARAAIAALAQEKASA